MRAEPADGMAAPQSPSEEPGAPPPAEPDPEPVRLDGGQIVLSEAERADWLGRFGGDVGSLDLALMEAAGCVQPRGAHAPVVQVRRQLARIARDRRDRDRRYHEARAAGGSSASSQPSWGAQPGHKHRGGEGPAGARSAYVARPGGGYIYGRSASEADEPRLYLPSTPEAQAYIARAERDGEPEDAVAQYRRRGLKLRPSEARRILAGGAIGRQPVAGFAGRIVARVASQRPEVSP